MITSIIFSKDRAAQCHLLLDSIRRHVPFLKVHILWKATSEDYKAGYDILFKRFEILPWEETDIKKDILDILDCNINPFVTFLTDDSIIYRDIGELECDIYQAITEHTACFSLRLGMNTRFQYQNNVCLDRLRFQYGSRETIRWKWQDYPPIENYGYVTSVDGHIFRSWQLRDTIKQLQFNSPNQLESNWWYKRYLLQSFPYMASFYNSALVTIPVNRTQDAFPNMAGTEYPRSLKELNDNYLRGLYPYIDASHLYHIIGCHQELPISWSEHQ